MGLKERYKVVVVDAGAAHEIVDAHRLQVREARANQVYNLKVRIGKNSHLVAGNAESLDQDVAPAVVGAGGVEPCQEIVLAQLFHRIGVQTRALPYAREAAPADG